MDAISMRAVLAWSKTVGGVVSASQASGALPPDGQISDFLSRPLAKNFPLSPSGKSPLQARAIPARKEGRIMIVTNVGLGCGGRRSAGRAMRSQG
jgi:hypothetical protein